MQRLRSALNAALARKALRIQMVAGTAPEWLTDSQAVEKDPAGVISEQEIKEIIAAVLPGQKLTDVGDMIGSLNVGAHGILKIRVRQTPHLSLCFYTPAGGTLFDSDSVPSLVPPAIPVAPMSSPTPPPPPPVAQVASDSMQSAVPGSFPAKIAFKPDPGLGGADGLATPPAPSSPTAIIPPPPIAVASIPMPPPVAVATVAPAILSEKVPATPETPSQLMSKAPAPAVVVTAKAEPQAVAQPQEADPADMASMFRVSKPAKKPIAKKTSVEPPLQAAPIPQAPVVPMIMAAPPVVQQVVAPPAAEPQEINFGNAEASEGSLSHGNNPIDALLKEMVQIKASDMHLTIGQPVIFRVHGDITRMSDEKISPDMMEKFLSPTIPPRNHAEFFKANDTDYAYELVGVGRFRVNIFRDRNGVGAVMRHIPSQILTAEQLNLPPAITKLCTLNKGLVLVTGPTGSGKSTTLAAMLDLINKTRKEHILTIEDPIEFVHPQQSCLVNQREVHKHTGSFARALKAALREDPDIVLIGEMRDLETIAIAIETAETGHLVFGTLHTTTAMSTVDRIIDQFPADRQAQIRTMLASSLRGVVTQTLLKKKGGGRVAAHEILISNDAVSAMIREGKIQHLANHMMTQKQDGNQLLNDALLKLVQDGLVDPQDAFFKSVDKNSFLASAKQRGIAIKLSEAG